MKVMSINSSQPAFNGYVDKSVTKMINKSVKEEASAAVSLANLWGRKVNTRELQDIKNTGASALEKLKNFMAQLHPDTALVIEKKSLKIKNKFIGGQLDFSISRRSSSEVAPQVSGVRIRGVASEVPETARRWEIFADDLTALENPNAIDKNLLDNFVWDLERLAAKDFVLFRNFRAKAGAEKADAFALESGNEPIYREKITALIDEYAVARENKKVEAKAKKVQHQKLCEDNEKTLNEILKS